MAKHTAVARSSGVFRASRIDSSDPPIDRQLCAWNSCTLARARIPTDFVRLCVDQLHGTPRKRHAARRRKTTERAKRKARETAAPTGPAANRARAGAERGALERCGPP
jgi:hypothetical protein